MKYNSAGFLNTGHELWVWKRFDFAPRKQGSQKFLVPVALSFCLNLLCRMAASARGTEALLCDCNIIRDRVKIYNMLSDAMVAETIVSPP